MADEFNPVIRTLRLHWFSVRPCFDLLSPNARTDSANTFLSEDRYYSCDHDCAAFRARRLGRRFKQERRVGNSSYAPHGFWATYMSNVAGPEYRGPWRGLAPMRIQFRDGEKPWVRVASAVAGSFQPELATIRAFPNCYLFPIGWTAGVVIEIRGKLSLDTCARLVQTLRRENVFECREKGPASLEQLLRSFHDAVRGEFVTPRPAQRGEVAANPYLVAVPLEFDDQGSFWGTVEVPKETLIPLLAGGPLPEEKQPLIMHDTNTLSMTVLNRGTILFASRPEYERIVPGCAGSNFKNSLLITMLMQKFCQSAFGHRNRIVTAMRAEVLETFRLLANIWERPHYRKICEVHTGIQKMRAEAFAQPPLTVTFNFDHVTFTGAAIGVNPQFNQDRQGNGSTSQPRGIMSSFNFNAPVTNAAIGDHATFMQNLQNVTVQQLASDLSQVHAVATERATNDAEKADAEKIGAAATEAHNGSKEKAVALLREVGIWGWGLIKELASSMAAASLKSLIGI